MLYRNTRTGAVVNVSSVISGEGWEPIEEQPSSKPEKEAAPKRKKRAETE